MPSAAIIDVRNARAVISRPRGLSASTWTHEPAANWEALEPMARAEVERQGGGITLSGLYPCPPELAALALWPEDILALVLTPAEAADRFDITAAAVRKAAELGRVIARKSGGTWLIDATSAAALWGQRDA